MQLQTTSLFIDLYELVSFEHDEKKSFSAKVRLNPGNEIYKAHFPGMPVTPGVCMIQIIKELSESLLKTTLMLTKTVNIKFMAVVNPEENKNITVNTQITPIDNESYKITASILLEDGTNALKFSGEFKKI